MLVFGGIILQQKLMGFREPLPHTHTPVITCFSDRPDWPSYSIPSRELSGYAELLAQQMLKLMLGHFYCWQLTNKTSINWPKKIEMEIPETETLFFSLDSSWGLAIAHLSPILDIRQLRLPRSGLRDQAILSQMIFETQKRLENLQAGRDIMASQPTLPPTYPPRHKAVFRAY